MKPHIQVTLLIAPLSLVHALKIDKVILQVDNSPSHSQSERF